jgi:hypothetical protein
MTWASTWDRDSDFFLQIVNTKQLPSIHQFRFGKPSGIALPYHIADTDTHVLDDILGQVHALGKERIWGTVQEFDRVSSK